jgi:diguanylate cyclase (GGDEF)-like protein
MQRRWKWGGDDVLAEHRERIMFPMAVASVVVLAPFLVANFIQGRYLLGTLILLVVLGFGSAAAAIYMKRHPPVPYAVLLLPIGAGMVLSLQTQGIYGAFWSYPLMLLCYFVLSWRIAILTSLALLVAVPAMVDLYIDRGMAVRVFASFALTIVIINIALHIIADLQRRLVDQTITDSLTGAFNRRHMEARLVEVIERHKRAGARASLLVLDIDHFKSVNDRLGHAAGDRVLKGVVTLVGSNSRKLDAVFRIGGEEFVLLLPDTGVPEAIKVAEHLRGLIAAAPLLEARPVTVSIGLSELAPGDDLDGWIRRADAALYAAKAAGRNRVECVRSAKF